MQKVRIYLEICGNYVAFNEINARVLYDVTNNISLSGYELEDLKESQSEYCEIKIIDAIKINDEYFYHF
jgi:hypothetical protein